MYQIIKGDFMASIPFNDYILPVPKEDVYGIGVSGPPVNENEIEEVKDENVNVIEEENTENSDSNIGKNVDTEA